MLIDDPADNGTGIGLAVNRTNWIRGFESFGSGGVPETSWRPRGILLNLDGLGFGRTNR
jgi:hypothetical protein